MQSVFCEWARWLEDYFRSKFDLVEEVGIPSELLGQRGQKDSAIVTRVLTSRNPAGPVKKLRITIVDAGQKVQALNAALYPRSSYGPLPLLGIDILSLNKGQRLLFGVDWAPLLPERSYQAEHIEPYLASVREQHSTLLQEPSTRFYGEDPEFFSSSMFFSRPASEQGFHPGTPLWKVFEGYCRAYTTRLLGAQRHADPEVMRFVDQRHDDYDLWHAERDPAVTVFKGLFGQQWSQSFVDKVLFPGSARLGRKADQEGKE